MFKGYLLDAVRNIKKSKGYSFINISGLTIGIACFILILMWGRDELSFDRFHENANEIFRVVVKKNISGNASYTVATPNAIGAALKSEFPEIINFTRTDITDLWLVRYGEKKFLNDLIGMADPSFFEMFTFPFIKGNPKTAFNDLNSVVITERFAKKYFGDEDPMNKTIKLSRTDFKVTGVIKDIPDNSHIWFDCIYPLANVKRFFRWDLESWKGRTVLYTYIQVQKGTSWKELEKKISGIMKKHVPELDSEICLQPLTDIHLKSKFDGDLRNYKQGDITYVYILFIIAVCILFIACFNYMNLSTARSSDRAKGIAIRKVSGANRLDIVKQFLAEAIFLSFIALILAVILVYFLLPVFNNLSGKQLTFSLLADVSLLLKLIIVAVVIGIISGSYPAFLLSSFQPVKIFKGSGSAPVKGGNAFLRKTLVVIQFVISAFLIFSTVVIYKQLEFLRTKDLGFNPHNVINFYSYHEVEDNLEGKKTLFMSNPGVLNFSLGNAPIFLLEMETYNVDWDGKNPNEQIVMYPSRIDYGYIELYQMKMVEGRSFSEEFSTDTSAFILNETAVKVTGLKSPLGKRFRINDRIGTIIGVVKDSHHRSLHAPIMPVVFMLRHDYGYVSVRISPVNVEKTLRFLEDTWNKINTGPYPFSGTFVDETIDKLYESDRKKGMISQSATLITLLISCMGLFGLASYTSRQRTKEIGIRKVSGASVSSIVWLISKEFLKWVIIALIIAYPLAWYVMNNWLKNFAYRIDIQWWMFVFTGVIALGIAFLTVSYQVIKAARANPIDSLRYE